MLLARRALVSWLVAVLAVAVISPAGPADAAPAVLDANTLPLTTSATGVSLAEGFPMAQTFVAGHDGGIARVDLGLHRVGTKDLGAVRVELLAVEGGRPGSVLASTVIPATALGSRAEGLVSAEFETGPALVAGQSYALLVEPVGCCAWLRYESPVGRYAEGTLLYRSGGAWFPWIAFAPGLTDALFAVYVRAADDVPPRIAVPPLIEEELTDPAGAVVSWSASAVDDVDGDVPVACSPHSGWTFPLGTTPVRCAATDTAGNLAEASFDVRVLDTTPPSVAFDAQPAYGIDDRIEIRCAASDRGSGVRETSCDVPYAADAWRLGVGTHEVTAYAVDVAGNRTDAATSFEVQVDAASLAGLTRRLVPNQGVAGSLAVKLERGQVDAFQRQLRALSGRQVSGEDAALLLDLSAVLL